MRATYRPIQRWPGELRPARRSTPFYARIEETWGLLQRELEFLDASDVVIQLALKEADIRQDGRPRANVFPDHPGVIVSFESAYGPLQYATDAFNHWHANLRAVALSLEALRRVDRYGVSRRGEQYTGWRALPSAGSTNGSVDRRTDAASVLLAAAGMAVDAVNLCHVIDGTNRKTVYRLAARRVHPDQGGTDQAFATVQEAMQILEGATP